tara:strand:- start:2077 stop:2688 length:612 start_codon:yes stop_codon:yes gene_type:complete
MSKKWTEAHPRDNAIADYKEFNRGYNEYKSSFNGGIDRTMTPSEAVDKSSVVDNAFHNMTIFRSDDMTALSDTNTGATLGDFRGLSYDTYGGGWVTVDEQTISNNKDGMLHWEFSSHIYNNTFYTENVKSVTMRLLFDGVEVCTLYKVPHPIVTLRMVCDFPITGGSHQAVVQARSVSKSDTENTKCLFTLLAMQHLFIGRWR